LLTRVNRLSGKRVGYEITSKPTAESDFAPGREVPVVDQLPEALLPLIVLRESLGLDGVSIMTVTGVFALLDVLSTRARHRSPAN
jgi:hypothetical protein